MNKFFAVLALVLGFAASAEAKLFDIDSFRLNNGMQVFVVSNHKAPIVKHMVWYKVGSMDEKLGKGGTAHLLEHLMFRGTKDVEGGKLNEIFEQNGAQSNAFTALDFTAYHQTLDISRLELAMYLEADRMQNLQIMPEDFALERDIVFQERQQVVENNPAAYFNEALRRSLWQNHPYGRPITGSPDEIKGLQQQDVEEFYQSFYSPQNAILVLSGDIDVLTAKKLAEKYYGPVPARKISQRPEVAALKADFKARLHLKLPEIAAPRLSFNYAVASVGTDKGRIYDYAVLAKYLGGSDTSVLYKDLVLKQKVALAVSASYDEAARSYGSFVISAVPAKGITAQKLEKLLHKAVEKAVAELNQERLEKVKKQMTAGLVYLQDNPSDAAYIIGSLASAGMSKDEIENYDVGIEKVQLDQVKQTALKMLEHAPQVVGILEPVGEEN